MWMKLIVARILRSGRKIPSSKVNLKLSMTTLIVTTSSVFRYLGFSTLIIFGVVCLGYMFCWLGKPKWAKVRNQQPQMQLKQHRHQICLDHEQSRLGRLEKLWSPKRKEVALFEDLLFWYYLRALESILNENLSHDVHLGVLNEN